MRRCTFIFLLFTSFYAQAQPAGSNNLADTRETLLWAQRQGVKIDSVLDLALRSADHATLLLKMLEAWHDFDAVIHAGLFCQNARVAAGRGRFQCDLINFRGEKDPASLQLRATAARLEAMRLRDGATACASAISGHDSLGVFAVLLKDADLVLHDLADALSVRDLHILDQKVEHALDLLHDMENIAETLPNCRASRDQLRAATNAAFDALTSDDWDLAAGHVRRMAVAVQTLQQSAGCQ